MKTREELETELAKAYEATDISVNAARSATFELSRVREELAAKQAEMDAHGYCIPEDIVRVRERRMADDWHAEVEAERAAHEKTKASYDKCFDAHDRLTHLYAAERARAERLEKALRRFQQPYNSDGTHWTGTCDWEDGGFLERAKTIADEALADTEVKP